MRSRNSGSSKLTAPVNKMTPGKKNAAKAKTAQTTSSEQASAASPTTVTPKSSDVKSGPMTRGKQIKSMESVSAAICSNKIPPETTPTAEGGKERGEADEATAEAKPTTRRKIIKRVVRRVVKKAPASSRVSSEQPLDPGLSEQAQVEVLGAAEPEVIIQNVKLPEKEEESTVKDIEDLKISNPEEGTKEGEDWLKNKLSSSENLVIPLVEQESTLDGVEPVEDIEPALKDEEESRIKEEEKLNIAAGDTSEPKIKTDEIEEDPEEDMTDFDGPTEEAAGEGIANQEVHDVNQENIPESDLQEQGGEAAALDEERAELNAAAEERKLRKELEIFVGGLDRDVVEDDIKRVFQHAGEVVDVRLYRDPTTNKNKGYAFVRFATKEQACRALSEMRNPVIRGKRCGIAASEDNDTLFLGNICNTWTKEAIKQKLKEYGVEAVEKITLVTDPKDEGLSRGFAFLEFTSHSEAMLAYKRLQKPDVTFGHPERTAKVAFAEPLREPHPEVMSQVKSVFVDGLPPHWDEDRVREKFKQFGEIARVMLARNMSTAKRKDFGFVDFTTHVAAVACVEGINNTEFNDGNSKTRVRARLANPLPKTQAVKGGMAGGFRITRGGGGTLSRLGGRGFGRGGHAFNRSNIQHGGDFYPHGPSQGGGRMNVAEAYESDSQYPPFYGMQRFGPEERWGSRGAHQMRNGPPLPARSDLDRSRHGSYDLLRRQPFPSEDAFNQPAPQRQFGYPRYYEDTSRGLKRPYFMGDQNPDYIEPSTRRPRFDYPQPSISHHETHYRDTFGADGGFHRQDCYHSDYERGMHPSFYGGDRPFRRGYYY